MCFSLANVYTFCTLFYALFVYRGSDRPHKSDVFCGSKSFYMHLNFSLINVYIFCALYHLYVQLTNLNFLHATATM